MKDVPFQLPPGIVFGAIPEREDPRDAFISNGPPLEALSRGATIGTSSLRRQVQLRHRFPAFNLVALRGNVDTRLRRLAAHDFDGIILAIAGLKRLGYEYRITQILDDDLMLPAVGQGALGIVCREEDHSTRRILQVLEHAPTRTAATAERGLLRALGGSGSLDGARIVAHELSGSPDQALELGIELGEKLLSMGAGEILAEIAQYGVDR